MAATPDSVHWRGVNHLALVTPDMDATVRFWHGVLGARLVATIGTPAFRHYFFDVGPGNTIAFFEYAGQHLDMYAKPAGVPYDKASQFDHLSLNLPDEEALLRLRDRLKSHDCEVTDVVDHGFIRSIYFSDRAARDGRAGPHRLHATRRRHHRGHLPHWRLTSAWSARSRSCCPMRRCATRTARGSVPTMPS
jgi:catechol 2,3-dioxygenase-like lactoylglutathione lyase family enzyme